MRAETPAAPVGATFSCSATECTQSWALSAPTTTLEQNFYNAPMSTRPHSAQRLSWPHYTASLCLRAPIRAVLDGAKKGDHLIHPFALTFMPVQQTHAIHQRRQPHILRGGGPGHRGDHARSSGSFHALGVLNLNFPYA
jgi:hypothetical protein